MKLNINAQPNKDKMKMCTSTVFFYVWLLQTIMKIMQLICFEFA